MQVTCIQSQSLPINSSGITALVRAVLAYKGVECEEVIVNFVDKETICQLHQDYFNDPSPTDCISFPMDHPDDPPSGYRILGEIFVCPEVALEYSESHALDPHRELRLYVVHGLLHLLGFDDQTEKERSLMQQEEQKCMEFFENNFTLTIP